MSCACGSCYRCRHRKHQAEYLRRKFGVRPVQVVTLCDCGHCRKCWDRTYSAKLRAKRSGEPVRPEKSDMQLEQESAEWLSKLGARA